MPQESDPITAQETADEPIAVAPEPQPLVEPPMREPIVGRRVDFIAPDGTGIPATVMRVHSPTRVSLYVFTAAGFHAEQVRFDESGAPGTCRWPSPTA